MACSHPNNAESCRTPDSASRVTCSFALFQLGILDDTGLAVNDNLLQLLHTRVD